VRLVAIAVLCTALAGCVPAPVRVDTPRTEAPDKSYTVDLPTGWIKQQTMDGNLIVSRDGYLLETVAVVRRPLKQAFERTKKDAADTMLPSELAELEIAEIKARDELTEALTVLENEPALISGKEGFRVRVSYRNQRGLEFHEEVYGAVDKSKLYLLVYRAPRLYYFPKHYPDFQKTVESFRIAQGQ
jgi:PsbP